MPFALNLPHIKGLTAKSLVAAHECLGSPLQPPTKSVIRIGNVKWTGIPLRTLNSVSKPLPSATFIWSEGLDSGTFAGITSDRYQKDLPLEKAHSDDILVAYKMNDRELSKGRGGPVRLVVPGWFGTNRTKWLCRLSLQDRRAPGPYTTTFYNVQYGQDPPDAEPRPVWKMDVDSMITRPPPGQSMRGPHMNVEGWAWSSCLVTDVTISTDGGTTWLHTRVDERVDCSWQKFSLPLRLTLGSHIIIARVTDVNGTTQPIRGCRNLVHVVSFETIE